MPTKTNSEVSVDTKDLHVCKQNNRFTQYRIMSLLVLMTTLSLIFGLAGLIPEYTGTLVQFTVMSSGLGIAGVGVLFGRNDERAFCIGVIASSGVLSTKVGEDFQGICWSLLHKLLHPYLEASSLIPVYKIIVPFLMFLVVIINGFFCLWVRKRILQ